MRRVPPYPKPKTNQSNTNQIMKLPVKNPVPAKFCSFVAIIMALVTIAASKAAADNHVRVFNEKVSGVPTANQEVIADNVLSPEFTPGLVAKTTCSKSFPATECGVTWLGKAVLRPRRASVWGAFFYEPAKHANRREK
jgi:hypothetical protein